MTNLAAITAAVADIQITRTRGTVSGVSGGRVLARGLGQAVRIGDLVRIERQGGARLTGEVVMIEEGRAAIMPYGLIEGVRAGDAVWLDDVGDPRPCEAWLGQVVDAFGRRLDGAMPPQGTVPSPLRAPPPQAVSRKLLGARLSTGLAAFDTMIPICRGQRIGVFAGSGVGKSRLMGALAQKMEADVVVIGLIGERGREVRDFVEHVLGAEAMKRAVVVAATSDQPAPMKRRAAWMALAIAEHFRDAGRHVLLLLDSVTRYAEAHREVALSGGEAPSLRAYPPSTTGAIAGLCERAGPGPEACPGDITAVFTVLVAGGDMEEPVADMTRGILDGHVILEREIAERGRYPAIDVRRSVSRSLPEAATEAENKLIARVRALLGAYEKILPMLQVGLYKGGNDPLTDEAVRLWPALDGFFAQKAETPEAAFEALAAILGVAHDAPA